jgi:hypothetical protein
MLNLKALREYVSLRMYDTPLLANDLAGDMIKDGMLAPATELIREIERAQYASLTIEVYASRTRHMEICKFICQQATASMRWLNLSACSSLSYSKDAMLLQPVKVGT